MNPEADMTATQVLETLEDQYTSLLATILIADCFYGDQEGIETLKEVGCFTFAHLQRPIFDSIALGFCRMYDPATVCGKSNMTLYRLAELLPNDAVKLTCHLESSKVTMKDIRALRNQIIAHSDAGRSSQSLILYEGVEKDNVDQCCRITTEALDIASRDIRGRTISYCTGTDGPGEPDDFLAWARRSIFRDKQSLPPLS